MTRRVQRFANLHLEQLAQAVFEQRDLAVGMDHGMGRRQESIQFRSRAQTQHRKGQRRQRQAQHRMQAKKDAARVWPMPGRRSGRPGARRLRCAGSTRWKASRRSAVPSSSGIDAFASRRQRAQLRPQRFDDAAGAAVVVRGRRAHLRDHHRRGHADLARERRQRSGSRSRPPGPCVMSSCMPFGGEAIHARSSC